MRLVIEQGRLPHYRVPFFEALGRQVESLTVVHSGAPTAAKDTSYEEVILPLRSAAGLYLQPGLTQAVRHADVLVAMFDLRWPMNIVETAFTSQVGRRLVWGHGLGRHRLLWPVRMAWLRRTNGIILYHRASADQLFELGISEEQVFVAPNAVALPTAIPVSSSRDSILFVGRLQERKRIDVLIAAFARLKTQAGTSQLWLDLVGDGPQRPKLERQVFKLGLSESVRFHGPIFEEALLGEFFARAIVYASPGWTGLGLLHAFAHAVPAIIGDGIRHPPEAHDLIPGVNGLRAAPNPEDFGRALAKVVADPSFRNRMGRAAAELVHSRRRIEDMVNGFMEALNA